MKVILAETAGFCYGVERAVNLARETAKARGGAMLGSIVHNAGVVREIEDLGMRLITSPDQAKAGRPCSSAPTASRERRLMRCESAGQRS